MINPLPQGVISKFQETSHNSFKNNDISHPHVIVKKEPDDGYSCPHRHPSSAAQKSPSLLYSDVARSLLLKDQSELQLKVNQSQTRIKRSLSNEFPEEEDTDSIGGKVGVTVETAVFVDETLYEIMRRTYPGLCFSH